jgi:hypothetical protein
MLDAVLCENEIGGVIKGSVEAAVQRFPLTRDQYLKSKRSNVPGTSEEGQRIRNQIYDEYALYTKWKDETDKYDVNDIVLALLQQPLPKLFSSGKPIILN